jgi:cytochrome c553
MAPIAHGLTTDQRKTVAAYYASLDSAVAAAAPAASDDGKALRRGQQLSEIGDEAPHVQACANCHGPGGLGAPPSFPYLAGQNPSYLSAALNAWKSGARLTDGSGQMMEVARGLSDADIAAVSRFFAGQTPPRPLDWKKTPAVPGAAPSTAPGPTAPTSGEQGVGSEQGLPVTGASQNSSGANSPGHAPEAPPAAPSPH